MKKAENRFKNTRRQKNTFNKLGVVASLALAILGAVFYLKKWRVLSLITFTLAGANLVFATGLSDYYTVVPAAISIGLALTFHLVELFNPALLQRLNQH